VRGPERDSGGLTRTALVRIALRVGAVIVAGTLLSYWHVVSTLEEHALEALGEYAVERARTEEHLFRLAESQQELARTEAQRLLKQAARGDPTADFERLLGAFDDGTTRTRLEGFDGTRDPFAFLGRNVELDLDLKRRVLVYHELSQRFGPTWRAAFPNFYVTLPENGLVGYWPEEPDWAHTASASLDIAAEEYSLIASPKENPKRQSRWTGLFFDKVSKAWMVSCSTPVDFRGRWVGTIGLDLPINDLMARTLETRLPGSYNFIIRTDGRLLAHPEMMAELEAEAGMFQIEGSGHRELERTLGLARQLENHALFEDDASRRYLAMTRLQGPGWIFVISYAKSEVTAAARKTASLILLLGLCSLLLELLIFYAILHRMVGRPLSALMGATEQVASGDLTTPVVQNYDGELGRLAKAFDGMRAALLLRQQRAEVELDERRHAEKRLQTTLAEREVLLREVHHRVKNNLQIVSSLLGLQIADVEQNPSSAVAALVSSRERVLAMARLHEKIYQLDALAEVDMYAYTVETADNVLRFSERQHNIELSVQGQTLMLSLDQAVPAALLLNELVLNAFQHAFPDGRSGHLRIELRLEGAEVLLVVADNGVGFSEEQLEQASSSLGLTLVRALAGQIDGDLTIASEPGDTRFELRFERSGLQPRHADAHEGSTPETAADA